MARLLIVDDNTEVRASLSHVLRRAGHDVVEAADGQQALERLREDRFDLMILDVLMPKLDGIAVLREAGDLRPGMPSLVISGGGPHASLEEISARADLHGAATMLFKPFESEELLQAVTRALSD